ncbi:MAG: phosphoglycerate mutase family protein [Betaproteobacteria bacterium]|nr:phosphoglycerate mutase family protein [Betaproteobacteria bacterium]
MSGAAQGGAPHHDTQLTLVRHGETAWNVLGRLQGHTDIALNAQGHAQAAAVAQALRGEPITAVLASDLQRAQQTAQALAAVHGLPVHTAPGLRERGYGVWEGETSEDIALFDAPGHARWRARDLHFAPQGGESLHGFAQRVSEALHALLRQHAGQRVVVVTHGGVLDVIYRLATATPLSAPRDWPLPNAALNLLRHGARGWQVVQWGHTAHLDGVAVRSHAQDA